MKYGAVKLLAAQSTENELISQLPYSCCQGNYYITHRAAVVKGVCVCVGAVNLLFAAL